MEEFMVGLSAGFILASLWFSRLSTTEHIARMKTLDEQYDRMRDELSKRQREKHQPEEEDEADWWKHGGDEREG